MGINIDALPGDINPETRKNIIREGLKEIFGKTIAERRLEGRKISRQLNAQEIKRKKNKRKIANISRRRNRV